MTEAAIPHLSQSPSNISLEQNFREGLTALEQNLRSTKRPALQFIDDFCQQVAWTLGEAIKVADASHFLEPGTLGWIWGQYRGTALSGKREIEDYYVAPDLGSRTLNDYLLEFYWATYGIGASVGELFHRRVLAIAPKATVAASGLVRWYAVRVTLEGDNLQFVDADAAQSGAEQNQFSYFELKAPEKWANILLPDKQFEELRISLNALALAAESGGEDGLRRKREIEALLSEQFRTSLLRNVNLLVAGLLADEFPEDKSASQARDFLNLPMLTNEACLEIVAKAVQMFTLYWRWRRQPNEDPGDFLVVAPFPISRDMRSMPLMGLAFAFKNRKETATQAHSKQIADFLTATLVPHLKSFATKWENQGTKAFRKLLEQKTKFLGSGLVSNLKESFDELHLNDTDFEQLLARIAPVLETVSELVPSFVHEGHRFGITIFLGLPYHEQILGAKVAGLEGLKLKLAPEVNETELDLTRPIIESCYSLLDSSDIVLFGRISSDINDPVHWTSLLKLDTTPMRNEVRSGWSNAVRYEAITRGHNNLLAISVEQSGKLRLFSGGKVLLQFRSDRWEKGTGTFELKQKLQSLFRTTLELPLRLDNAELDDFASLIQRISEMPGAGALFIITPSSQQEVDVILPEISAPPEDLYNKGFGDLLKDPLDTIFRLATMDGATVICIEPHKGTDEDDLDFASAKIYPRRIIAERFHLKEITDRRWPEWRESLSYGARRMSAVALALKSGSPSRGRYLCVVVSSDGPVYLMPGYDNFVESH